jgi:hypothetical protein
MTAPLLALQASLSMIRRVICAVAAVSMSMGLTLAAPGKSELGNLPAALKSHALLHDTTIEGRAVRVWAVTAASESLSADMLARHVEESWRSLAGAAVQRDQVAGWSIVSRYFDGHFETLQIKVDTQPPRGYLSIWGASVIPSALAVQLERLLPESLHVVRRLSASEGGSSTASIVARSDESPKSLQRLMTDRALRRGFKRIEEPINPSGLSKSDEERLPPPQRANPIGSRFIGSGLEIVITFDQIDRTTVAIAHLRELSQ